MMILKEVKNGLLKEMEPAFIKHGFFMRKSDRGFKRSIEDGMQEMYFIMYEKNNSIFIEPRWSIKIESIISVYHKITIKSEEFFKNTVVLENSLFELIDYVDNKNEKGGSNSKKYLIENKEDYDLLIEIIPERFEKYVLPYFNLNNSVLRMDELLNFKPAELSVHQWLYPYKAIMGVIAARLTNNPNLKELIAIYDEHLQDASPDYKEEFRRLKNLIGEI